MKFDGPLDPRSPFSPDSALHNYLSHIHPDLQDQKHIENLQKEIVENAIQLTAEALKRIEKDGKNE